MINKDLKLNDFHKEKKTIPIPVTHYTSYEDLKK